MAVELSSGYSWRSMCLAVRGKCDDTSHPWLSVAKPEQSSVLLTFLGITHFQTVVSLHFRSLKDQVLKMELSVPHSLAAVISAIIRLREWLRGFLTTQ